MSELTLPVPPAPTPPPFVPAPAAALPPGEPLTRLSRLVRGRRAGLLRVARTEGLTAPAALLAVRDAFETLLTLPQAAAVAADDEWLERVLRTLVRHVARRRAALQEIADLAGRVETRTRGPGDAPARGARGGQGRGEGRGDDDEEDDERRAAEALVEAADARLRAEGGRGGRRAVERAVITLRLFEPGVDAPEVARAGGADDRLIALRRGAAAALRAYARGGARA
jgi:hypothetical protein